MNRKLKVVQDQLANKLRRDILVAGGIVGIGLSSGIVAPDLMAVISVIGGTKFASDAAKLIFERKNASDELKSEDLYFLWKVAQKARHN